MNSNTLYLFPLVLALVGKQVIFGAVYFMLNDPNGNSVIANGISSNGKLISSSTFQTGGNGGITDYSKTNFNGLDPLASQNSLIVSGSLLFAVNAGSNSISVFSIRTTDPICLTLISVVGSGGEFPIVLAFSAKLELLCVLNGGRNNNSIPIGSKHANFSQMMVRLWVSFANTGKPTGANNGVEWLPIEEQILYRWFELSSQPKMIDLLGDTMNF